MALQMWISGLLVLASMVSPAEAMNMYDPQLCYILDGFLGIYGLIITAMFIKEKDLKGQDPGTYEPLRTGDPEIARGRNRRVADDATYTGLNKRTDGEYKELPLKRPKKNEQVYQGLSSATRDTYDSLQMQSLPPR
uniref:T-cell surface glycoprotein CD3 zeta chain n=1 Tax=Astatotilapia calliptera TaxID=8154 RepID=A0AAX7W2G7_ASTCA